MLFCISVSLDTQDFYIIGSVRSLINIFSTYTTITSLNIKFITKLCATSLFDMKVLLSIK